jgi:hypothetical protein
LTDDSLHLPSGLALAPHLAAQCRFDEQRTSAFLRGTAAAIEAARARFPGETIEVVYAGTGPFAPLVLPLLPLPGVRCTFIDVDARSLDMLRALRPPARLVHADATQYVHEAPLHVVVSETMQRSLAAEPFVAILHNLRAQLAPGGFFVPERVTVDAVLIDPEREMARWDGGAGAPYVPLARVLDTTRELAPVHVTVPPTEWWLALATEIDVFDGIRLAAYDSGLTVPEILWPFSPSRTGAELELRYQSGARPGIVVRERRNA